MLKKIPVFLTWISLITVAPAQNAITLEYCLSKAEANHPLSGQFELLASRSELNLKNLNRNYLPEMNINGDMHYQSDVVQVPVKLETFAPEPLDKDWYKISLDVNQLIYDAGITRKNKEIELIDQQISAQSVSIDLYEVKEKIVAVYFSIISLQENKKLLGFTKETLQSRLAEVESGVRNGIILASDAEILQAEILKIGQKEIELEISVNSGYKLLSILTGEEIAAGTALEMGNPQTEAYLPGTDRPEFRYFDLQSQKTESMKKLSTSRILPRFIAYGQAGYGRPGFDMLKNEFDDFYMIGIRMNWNIWNWNKSRNEKMVLDLNKQIIESNKDAFSQGLDTDLERKMAEIIKTEQMISKDEEIVLLRENIVSTYESRLKNGVITSTEYITELNAESEAKLNLLIRNIQLTKARYEYLAVAGKL